MSNIYMQLPIILTSELLGQFFSSKILLEFSFSKFYQTDIILHGTIQDFEIKFDCDHTIYNYIALEEKRN